MPKERELLHTDDICTQTDTNGIESPEVALEWQVPNDEAWSLSVGTLLELFLPDGSNNHLPPDAFIYITKWARQFTGSRAVPGAKMIYNNWNGFNIQEQRSDEFKDNTRIQMAVNNAIFKPRNKLQITVDSDTAVDVSQANLHAKLSVKQINSS